MTKDKKFQKIEISKIEFIDDLETQEATMSVCLSQNINRFNSIDSSMNSLMISSMNLKTRKMMS